MPVGTNSSDRSKPTRNRLLALTGLAWFTELITSAVLSPQLMVWLPILQVGADLPQRLAVLALAVHDLAGAVGLVETRRVLAGTARAAAADGVAVLRGDHVRVVLHEIVVDEIVEVQPLGEHAELAVGQV